MPTQVMTAVRVVTIISGVGDSRSAGAAAQVLALMLSPFMPAFYVGGGTRQVALPAAFLSEMPLFVNVPGPAGAASLTVTWDAPILPATIIRYKVAYGQISGGSYPYAKWLEGSMPMNNTVTITGLAAGTYYIVICAYDSIGTVSDPSPQTAKDAV